MIIIGLLLLRIPTKAHATENLRRRSTADFFLKDTHAFPRRSTPVNVIKHRSYSVEFLWGGIFVSNTYPVYLIHSFLLISTSPSSRAPLVLLLISLVFIVYFVHVANVDFVLFLTRRLFFLLQKRNQGNSMGVRG